MDLVAGTHGRAVWIADDLTGLQQLTADVRQQPAHLFAPRRATLWSRISLGRKQPNFLFRGENPPRAALLHSWFAEAPATAPKLTVATLDGTREWTTTLPREAGLHRTEWPLRFEPNDADRAALRATLGAAIARIRARIPRPANELPDFVTYTSWSNRLDELESQLAQADSDRRLNRIRDALRTEFARFAGGEPTFGHGLGRIEAGPGTYRVTLAVGQAEHTTTVTVRADPLGR